MNNNEFPRVVQAAITSYKDFAVHTLPVPANHLDIIACVSLDGLYNLTGEEVEGFILEDGTFTTREFALECAIRNSQILPDQIDKIDGLNLYCENVW